MSVQRLVLFDIDGTLLKSHGAGRRAMETALLATFGSVGPENYRYDGKTDRQIVRELMRHEGHDDGWIDAHMTPVLDRYLAELQRELARPDTRVAALAGVTELLALLLSHSGCTVGLLTGNLEPGARHKLTAAGIDAGAFSVGAYGSDHEVRDELPAIARSRAREFLGVEVRGEDVVIIGDTPSDIHCGRSIRARAIAVATGSYSVAELARHRPAAVFADLTATRDVLKAIEDGADAV